MSLAYSPATDATRAHPETRERAVSLCDSLRASTGAAHERLEASLSLLSRISDRQWVQSVVERFFGFHLEWEQAIARRAELRAFHQPRSRLPHLRRDLAALGLTTAELDRIPTCALAGELAASLPAAVGSIYVMEGSTLGGQVITRALSQADWLPAGGLTYFHPYGSRTGEMWRSFRRRAEIQVEPQDDAEAIASADRTFDLLREWLTP